MSIELSVKNKVLPASNLQGHIIQGENNAASVQIILPLEQSGVSLAGYDWEMRGTLVESNVFAIASLQKQEDTEKITLTWLISSDFTGEDGPLQLVLVGIKDGEDIFKFIGNELTVVANTEGVFAPEANYFENVLNEIRNLVNQAQAAAENAPVVGENGNWFYYNAITGQYDIDSGESARGIPGNEGPQGPPGIGLTVLDYYNSLSELEQSIINPSPGDAYGVGTSAPFDIYVYGETQEWVNNGPIQGPPGQDGQDGQNGQDGQDGAPGYVEYVASYSNNVISLTNEGDNSPVLIFTAPVNYTPSMTFEINGTTIPATLIGGEPLPDGAFAVGDVIVITRGNNGISFGLGGATKLVASYTTSSNVSSINIAELDINRDGGIYDIVTHLPASASAQTFTMRINNISSGYVGMYRYFNESTMNGTTGAAQPTGIIHNVTNSAPIFYKATISYAGGVPAYRSEGGCIASASSFVLLEQDGWLNNQVGNITSLNFTGYFPTGTRIRIYKR